MPTPIHAAQRRLQGQLIETPMIGDVRLPGPDSLALAPGVRVKVECMQMGGCLMFRGYLHYLLGGLGQWKGLVSSGSPREIYAQAVAANLHRLPIVAVVGTPLPAMLEDLVRKTGCEIRLARPDDLNSEVANEARRLGFHPMPGLAEPAVFDGVATLGLELADQMPREIKRVLIAPIDLAAPVRAGLEAASRDCIVCGEVPEPDDDLGVLRNLVTAGLRVESDPAGLVALLPALNQAVDGNQAGQGTTEPICVVLSQ